jgi:hypothetical protein
MWPSGFWYVFLVIILISGYRRNTLPPSSVSIWKAVLLFLNSMNTDQNPSNPKGLNCTKIRALQVPTHQPFFRCLYEICFRVFPKFILLTDGHAGDLRNKQNSIEQRVRIWFMLQTSDTLFCSVATILNWSCNLCRTARLVQYCHTIPRKHIFHHLISVSISLPWPCH